MAVSNVEVRRHKTHFVRETSIESWLNLACMGEMQRVVYQCILKNSRNGLFMTDREIADELNLSDPNAVRPRRYELAEMGLIEEAGRRTCSVTHRNALTWKVKDTSPVLQFDGNKAVQTVFLDPEKWQQLREAMEKHGYRYVGDGSWEVSS